MFAVTGATGKVGGAVARALLARGQPVRAVIRNPDKTKALAERGCEVAIAESDNAASLAKAFEDVEGAFVMLPPIFDPAPGFVEANGLIAALCEALAQAKPANICVLSTIGAEATEPNLLKQLGLLEEALVRLPLPISVLRAAWFMENAAWDVPSARETGIIQSYLQPLDKTFPMVAAKDVGQTAAELLLETSASHRIVELEGPRRVSPNDIAQAFAKTLGRPVAAEIVPRESWETLFRGEGMRHPEPRMQMLDGFNAGWISFSSDEANRRRGTITIEDAIDLLVQEQQRGGNV